MSTHKPNIILIGAGGRMGKALSTRFLSENKVNLVAAVDRIFLDERESMFANTLTTVAANIKDLSSDISAEIVLDFSVPDAVRTNLEYCLKRGWDVIIGVTGFNDNDIHQFKSLSDNYRKRVLLVPNFTIGINLLLKFVRHASQAFKHVEIVEMHHEKKIDSPSGTAIHTAGEIAKNRINNTPPYPDSESRGQIINGIPVHSIRMQGLLAHQEVIFGNEGEILTIRHDTFDRSAFMTGIYLAIDRLEKLKTGFTVGLDWAFDE